MAKFYKAKDLLGNRLVSEKDLSENAFVTEEVFAGQLDKLKKEIKEAVDTKISSVLHWKGTVPTAEELPQEENEIGDVYSVEDTGSNYAWDGDKWDKLGEDLSGLATIQQLEELKAEVELKANASELTEHVENQDIHVDADKKAQWDENTENISSLQERVETLEIGSISADNKFEVTPSVNINWGSKLNASCNYFQVHARYLKGGKINKITIGGNYQTTYNDNVAYLTLFTSSDGDTWTKLATSNNSAQITTEVPGEFLFDDVELKQDVHVRFVFSLSNEDVIATNADVLMGISGMKAATDDPITMVFGSCLSSTYLARFSITYSPSETESVKEHLSNLSEHWVGMEKSNFLNFMQGYDGVTSIKDILDRLKALEALHPNG